MEDYLTPQQAAFRKGVSVAAIYKAIAEGRIPAEQFLNRFALRPADVDAYEPGSYTGLKRAIKPRGRRKQTGKHEREGS